MWGGGWRGVVRESAALVLETWKSREEGVKMIHANPCVGVSYGEEWGLLEGWRNNLDASGRCDELRIGLLTRVDLHMLCRLSLRPPRYS